MSAYERIVRKRHIEEDTHRLGGFWGFLGVKNRGNGKRAIATKAIQVCFSLLLEFWPMFDFSACLFFEYLLYCWFCVDGKGHKLFWLILVAYLFASNLLWSFPLAWAHLKMWLYRLPSIFIIMPIGSLLVFSVLDHSSKFPGDCLLSIPYKPILLGR